MTQAEELAAFAVRASYADLSALARDELKARVLDSVACAIGAVGAEPVQLVRAQIDEFDGCPACSLIGGGRASPDRAALYNGALVRYLDYNDSYLAKGETCHPSDNFAPVLAAVEYGGGTGRDLMVALAVSYQVQCRLSDEAPVRAAGFDHTTQGAYAVAAGVSRALGLEPAQAANALAISGASLNALRVTRTGKLSHWKGLAYPHTAAGAVWAALLARRGVTGPIEVFEGHKGFMHSIAGPFRIEWSREDLERVTRTLIKKHNAEIHSQTAIEAALALRREHRYAVGDVDRIDVEIFDVGYHIIGGGEEGNKTLVRTKEQADHSLPYLIAVAMLDNAVLPDQFAPDRIRRADVQALLSRVVVRESRAYSQRFPDEMPCRVTVTLRDGRAFSNEVSDYGGRAGPTSSWQIAIAKLEQLCHGRVDAGWIRTLVDAIRSLETIDVSELTALLTAASLSYSSQPSV